MFYFEGRKNKNKHQCVIQCVWGTTQIVLELLQNVNWSDWRIPEDDVLGRFCSSIPPTTAGHLQLDALGVVGYFAVVDDAATVYADGPGDGSWPADGPGNDDPGVGSGHLCRFAGPRLSSDSSLPGSSEHDTVRLWWSSKGHTTMSASVPQRTLELHDQGRPQCVWGHFRKRQSRNGFYLRRDIGRRRPCCHAGLLVRQPHRV